ncbi:MAG: type II toxin-antitoxin system RelE/ParE family toxin [Firmicutes bacterium]|nr:type II toxin-antitoxin system RelE/ParE family toxin [Bacillota bacterium]
MKREVNVAKSAIKDLERIVAYIAADNPDAADKMHDRIIEAIVSLSDYPYKGSILRSKGIKAENCRKLVVDNYIAIYRVPEENSEVHVIRIFHGAMNYERYI